MTILCQIAEDIDYELNMPATSGDISTTGANHDTSIGARCAMRKLATGANAAKGHLFAPQTACWMTARVTQGSNAQYANLGLSIDADVNNQGVYVGRGSTSNKLALFSLASSGSATILAEEAGASLGSLIQVSMHVKSLGASAAIDVYIGSTKVIEWTGDLSGIGVTAVERVILRGGSSGYWWTSEVIVADEDPRLFRLATLAPNAAGDANAWTGAYTDIDEVRSNDTDGLFADTVDLDAQVNVTGMPTGTFTVKSVQLGARVAKSAGSTAGSISLGVKSNGSIDAGTPYAATTAWENIRSPVLSTNPVTGNLWQPSDIDALQMNFRSST